jgi:hypothetical protein
VVLGSVVIGSVVIGATVVVIGLEPGCDVAQPAARVRTTRAWAALALPLRRPSKYQNIVHPPRPQYAESL